MAVQTSYGLDLVIAFAGMLANATDCTKVTKIATAATSFGLGCTMRETETDGPEEAAPPTSEDDVTDHFRGIAIKDETRLSGDGYEVGDPLCLVTRGQVWVPVEETVSPDDPVYCRFEAGAGPLTVLGKFRKDADTDKAAQVPGARYLKMNAAASLALVEINLP